MTPEFRLKDFTYVPLEIIIIVFSFLPFLILAFFYAELPAQIPAFLKLDGSVALWAEKSPLTAFRLPLMALVMQIIGLIMKYNAVAAAFVQKSGADLVPVQKRSVIYNTRLWDCFRILIALKVGASALVITFLSIERLNFLAAPAFWATTVPAFIAVTYGLYNRYKSHALKKEIQLLSGGQKTPPDKRRVYGGIFYFNPQDKSVFAGKYVFNFGNRLAYVFLACVIAYPLLVFSAV